MVASELRIGNLFQLGLEYLPLVSIDNDRAYANLGCVVRIGDKSVWLGRLDPIPLTEEILLKCGFERSIKENILLSPYEGSQENESFSKMVFSLKDMSFIVNSNNYDSHEVKCCYLHQLQNLYFALTGQELKIRLQHEIQR